MKIIIDTNIWISFMIGKQLSFLRSIFSNQNITVFVCDELLAEISDVSSREKIRKYITDEDVKDTFSLIKKVCQHANIEMNSESPIRDAKDKYLLSLADVVNADYIVSGDKDLLVLGCHHNTKIVTIQDFMWLFGK